MIDQTLTETRKLVSDQIELLQKEAFALNDWLADHPELPGQEFESCEAICKVLEKHGIPVERKFAGQSTAFRGTVRKDASSSVKIGILTEYDALPGVGHACGHCASGTISVLSALALAGAEGLPACNIDIIGTPDEENRGGKAFMADDGVFDEYAFVVMIHMGSGKMNVVKADMLALAPFYFHFKGAPAHAAACPWDGKNALNGATLMMHAVDMLRQHVRPSTRIHGIITHGGDAPNIVPEAATVDLLVRSPDKYYMEDVIRKLKDCAEGAARATQTEVEIVQYAPAFDNMLHIPTGIKLLSDIYEELGIPNETELQGEDGATGSSDVGNASFRCPSFQTMLSVCEEPLTMHSREYAARMKTDETKRVIGLGAEVITRMIVETLYRPELLDQMQAEFKEQVKK